MISKSSKEQERAGLLSSKGFDRRHFLGALAYLCTPILPVPISWGDSLSQAGSLAEYLVSAQGRDKKNFGVAWVDKRERKSGSVWSGFRGHSVVQHPQKKATVIAFSRRPGIQAVEINVVERTLKKVFECEPGRHLFGHGCFSADGSVLFTSEADYESGKGKIVIRDAKTYTHLGEYESYGVGPHELKLMPDGKTIVVANGGILTHPNTGRKGLNLDSMVSTLTYLDLASGTMHDHYRVPEPKASIRHIDVSWDGAVSFAMQVQREYAGHQKIVPLCGIHKAGKALALFDAPDSLVHQMKDYIGSVAVNNDTRVAGFTSPRGNLAAFWNIDSLQFIGYHAFHDVSGITVSKDMKHFSLSNSLGHIRQLDGQSLEEYTQHRLHFPGLAWDNHLLAITV